MSLLGAILLGAVQGFTEFLPISSSGHLAVLQHYIDVGGNDLAFDLLLHLGTLVPVVVLFRTDLLRMFRALGDVGPFWQREGVRWALFVVLASIPTVIMGLLLKDVFEAHLSGFLALSWQFAITALALHATQRLPAGTRNIADMTARDALLIGVAQGLAIIPAISRSGATIVTGVALGLDRDLAGRFSFVISIPAILGAALLAAKDVADEGGVNPADAPAWVAGTAAALIVGWVSLIYLMRVIRAGNFAMFAWYCWAMAAICLGIGLS